MMKGVLVKNLDLMLPKKTRMIVLTKTVQTVQ